MLKKKKKKINMLCLWSHGYSFDLLPHTTTNDVTLLFIYKFMQIIQIYKQKENQT